MFYKNVNLALLLVIFLTTSFVAVIGQNNQDFLTGKNPEEILVNSKEAALELKADEAVPLLRSYITQTGDLSAIKDSEFKLISNSIEFIELKNDFEVKFDARTFFYLYVGLIGIFIAVVLNIRKRTDKIANALISVFVFIHSFFLIHVSLYLTNYTYYAPDTLSMSTVFSFLYGPILYFYFKRINENYVFKPLDLLHLVPTLVLIAVFLPIYTLSTEEKLQIMLGVGEYESHPYLKPITIIKLISLLVYGYLTFKIFRKSYAPKTTAFPKKIQLQKTIMSLHAIYALSYAVYAFFIVQYIFSGIIFHGQLFAMTAIVLYVGYIAYANPKVLSGVSRKVVSSVKKYKNSGLTTSFSLELKEQLEKLMQEERLYRQNDIKLATIAEKLGTTRHNASQVINEHFGLNFFEYVNKYRVEEAMQILKSNDNNLNIIDIAYEVGYNNKVTFNKSFKRFVNLTPSQFVKLQVSA